jgi:hypothetical protein
MAPAVIVGGVSYCSRCRIRDTAGSNNIGPPPETGLYRQVSTVKADELGEKTSRFPAVRGVGSEVIDVREGRGAVPESAVPRLAMTRV